jgi:hypothetical protein
MGRERDGLALDICDGLRVWEAYGFLLLHSRGFPLVL